MELQLVIDRYRHRVMASTALVPCVANVFACGHECVWVCVYAKLARPSVPFHHSWMPPECRERQLSAPGLSIVASTRLLSSRCTSLMTSCGKPEINIQQTTCHCFHDIVFFQMPEPQMRNQMVLISVILYDLQRRSLR